MDDDRGERGSEDWEPSDYEDEWNPSDYESSDDNPAENNGDDCLGDVSGWEEYVEPDFVHFCSAIEGREYEEALDHLTYRSRPPAEASAFWSPADDAGEFTNWSRDQLDFHRRWLDDLWLDLPESSIFAVPATLLSDWGLAEGEEEPDRPGCDDRRFADELGCVSDVADEPGYPVGEAPDEAPGEGEESPFDEDDDGLVEAVTGTYL